MSFRTFVRDLAFRRISPDHVAQQLGKQAQVECTELPPGAERIKSVLAPINGIPRMSTFTIGAMINYGVSGMAPQDAFLNIGVWHGYTLLAGMLGNPDKCCIGVDDFSKFGSPYAAFLDRFKRNRSDRHFFYLMDYEQYFDEYHQGPIGLYMYDGAHEYHHQVKGLRLAEPFFADDCIVMVDDANWGHTRKATLDFIRESDSDYEMLLDQRTACNGHPTFWNGVMVFQRVGH